MVKIAVLGKSKSFLTEDDTIINAAVRAALSAINSSGLFIKNIDCIVCTSRLTRPQSFSAENIKRNLGLLSSNLPVKDVQNAFYPVSHFIDSIKAEVEAGHYERVLVISCEASPFRLNWDFDESLPLSGEVVWAFVVGKELDDSHFFFSSGETVEACN